jgi:hypothetical protein
MSGPPPKPLEVKRRTGNPGKRALPDPASTAPLPGIVDEQDLPAPARPLRAAGKAMWRRVWSSGAVWLARVSDAELVLLVCEQVDERQALRREVLKYGGRFERAALRALEKQIMLGLSMLGLTPTDRARLGVAEVKVESTVARLRRERDAEDAARESRIVDGELIEETPAGG